MPLHPGVIGRDPTLRPMYIYICIYLYIFEAVLRQFRGRARCFAKILLASIGLRTRGLVVKSCAVPVWRLSFVLILGHWPHIGPVPGATLGCLWGPGGLPNGARRLPRDNPRRPKPPPWSASGVPLGAGPPEGGRGPQGDNPGDPKWASRRRGAQVF